MNEFLEQLVRVLTNAYSRSQRMFGERISPGSTNQRSCLCLPCCWGAIAKSDIPWTIWLIMLCLFPYQRVFYALASWCPSQRTKDFSKRRGLLACVQTATPTANFWAQIIFDPYRRPLTLTFLYVSTRGFTWGITPSCINKGELLIFHHHSWEISSDFGKEIVLPKIMSKIAKISHLLRHANLKIIF